MFVPIFEKDGNKFFIPAEDFVAEDSWDASKIGLGASLVECILLDMKYTGENMEIDPENIPHRKAMLGSIAVAIIDGPLFETVKE